MKPVDNDVFVGTRETVFIFGFRIWDFGFGIFSGNGKLEHSEIPLVIFCEMNEMNELRKSNAGGKR